MSPDARALAPGGEGRIQVTVSTAGRAGRMVKGVRVETNDPERPISNLSVQAQIVPVGRPVGRSATAR